MSTVVSLRKAADRTGRNPHYVKGRAEGMGIPLEPVGTSLVMSEADFRRLVRALRRDGYAVPTPA